MLRFIVRRLLWLVVSLIAVAAITFALFFVGPNDPAAAAVPKGATPQIIQEVRVRMGLNKPIWEQFLDYLFPLAKAPQCVSTGGTSQIFQGATSCNQRTGIFQWPPNFGYSFKNLQPVGSTLLDRAPPTLSLAFGAAILWVVMGVSIGILAALRPRSVRDRVATIGALIGVSFPTFLLGIMLLDIFFFKLSWLPGPGYVYFTQSPWGWFTHLILPWFSLALVTAAFYSRMVRANMLETMGEDFIRTARAKGLSERRVIGRHILRASLTPVVTMLGMDIGLLIGGAIVTERVFGFQGIGATAIEALTNVDLPVITGTVLVTAFAVMFFNLIVDIIYAGLDPRVKYS